MSTAPTDLRIQFDRDATLCAASMKVSAAEGI